MMSWCYVLLWGGPCSVRGGLSAVRIAVLIAVSEAFFIIMVSKMSHQIYIRDDLKWQVPDSRLGGHCLSLPEFKKDSGCQVKPDPQQPLVGLRVWKESTWLFFCVVCLWWTHGKINLVSVVRFIALFFLRQRRVVFQSCNMNVWMQSQEIQFQFLWLHTGSTPSRIN